MREDRLTYTEDELRSFLPLGWHLAGEGDWDEKRRVLTLTVLDGVDFDWPVAISAREAESEGRLGALQKAMDRVFRDRLGQHTRGLGRAS